MSFPCEAGDKNGGNRPIFQIESEGIERQMKKIVVIFIALVLSAGMVGCGSRGGSSEAESLYAERETDDAIDDRIGDKVEDGIEDDEEQGGQNGFNSVQSGAADTQTQTDGPDSQIQAETEDVSMKMNVQIGDMSFTATLEDNAATRELIEMMKEEPITIDMSDYSGFEKVGPLGRSLTTDNHQTTTSAGDIVLYSGNQIVMFYGSNSWSYTKIGRIDNLDGWEDTLGSGSITAVFSLVVD